MNDEAVTRQYPIADLHCDLLHYLATMPGADPGNTEAIGCAIPHLVEGNVKLQVMAIASVEAEPEPSITERQIQWYERLSTESGNSFLSLSRAEEVVGMIKRQGTGMVTAVESAGALCANDDPIDTAFARLEEIVSRCGKPLYISLTHHGETRFGGGNFTDIGLKPDGRALIDYLDGRGIAVDLSHTSDRLAFDILEHVDAGDLKIPIIASHSNYREVYDHRRNLPDELAKEVVRRNGLIGLNFLRAFVDPENADTLTRHLEHGFALGGESAVCFGADYFCIGSHPDQSRRPFFHEGHENAGRYQSILGIWSLHLDEKSLGNISFDNVAEFMRKNW